MNRKQKGAKTIAATKGPDRRAEIIKLSVKYLQLIAAYDAVFAADPTGDWDFASAGDHIPRAEHVLLKLMGLSPSRIAGTNPLCLDELIAKAAVLKNSLWLPRE